MSKQSFSTLPDATKAPYLDRALRIIYPGLEPAFIQHDKMLVILATALFKCDQLALEGTR